MPCRGLLHLIKQDIPGRAFERISLRDYVRAHPEQSRVVIDGTALMHCFLARTDWSFGGETEQVRRNTLNFVAMLHKIGVTPLVYFDGVVSHSNVAGGLRKSVEKIHKLDLSMAKFESDPTQFISRRITPPCLFPLVQDVVIEALQSAGVSIKVCEAECARYCHAAAANEGLILMGYDNNYLCMADLPAYIYIDSVQEAADREAGGVMDDLMANMIVPASVGKELFGENGADRMQLLSCVLGNDVSPEWAFTHLYRHLLTAEEFTNDTRRERAVEAVANYIASFPADKTLEEIFDEVVALALKPLPEEKLNEGEAERIAAQIAEFKAKKSAETADADEDDSEAGYVAFIAASDEEKRTQLLAFFARSQEMFTPHAFPKHCEREHTFYKAIAGKSRLSGVSDAYFAGDFPTQLMSVLISGMNWYRPCLENPAAPAACLVSQPIRAAAYAVVLGDDTEEGPEAMRAEAADRHVVREAYRAGNDYTLHDVELSFAGMPSYEKARKMKTAARRTLMYNILGVDAAQRMRLSQLPEAWLLPTLAIIYLHDKKACTSSFPVEFVMQHFTPPTDDGLAGLHRRNLLARTPADLHFMTQWMITLQSIVMLNAALHGAIPTGRALAELAKVDLADIAAGRPSAAPVETICLGLCGCSMGLTAIRRDLASRRDYLTKNVTLMSPDHTVGELLESDSDGFTRKTGSTLTPAQIVSMDWVRKYTMVLGMPDVDAHAYPQSNHVSGVAARAAKQAAERAARAERSTRATVKKGGCKFAGLGFD